MGAAYCLFSKKDQSDGAIGYHESHALPKRLAVAYGADRAEKMLGVGFSIVQFGHVSSVLILCFFLIGLDIVVGNYVEPRYAGYRLNMSPLIVMMSLVFWGWLWGAVGLVLAVPIMVGVKAILENLPSTQGLGILMSHTVKK